MPYISSNGGIMALTETQADAKLLDYDRAVCTILMRILDARRDDPTTPVDESTISGLEWASILSTAATQGTSVATDALLTKLTWHDLEEIVGAYVRRGVVI
jgi:hypothetical protein